MVDDDIRYNLTPTEVVSRAISEDAAHPERWSDILKSCQQEAQSADQVQTGVWTEDEGARMLLAERLPLALLAANPLRGEDGVYGDLLRVALADVNWHAVAASLI